jgi:hypothetical protein
LYYTGWQAHHRAKTFMLNTDKIRGRKDMMESKTETAVTTLLSDIAST